MKQNFIFQIIDYKTSIIIIAVSIIISSFIVISGVNFLPLVLFLSGISGLILLVSIFLKDIKILDFLAALTLISNGLGAFNTYTSAREFWISFQLQYPLADIALAVISLNIYSLTLILLARTSKLDTFLIKEIEYILVSLSGSKKNFLTYFGFIISVIQIVLIVSGQAVFTAAASSISTSQNDPDYSNAYYIGFLYSLCSIMPLLIGVLFAFSLRKRNLNNPYLWLITFTNLIWVLLSGRRNIFYGFLIAFLGFKIATNQQEKILIFKKLISIKTILIFGLLFIIFYFSLDLFGYMRFYSYTHLAKESLLSYITNAFSSYIDLITNPAQVNSYNQFKKFTSENLSTRTFGFGFLVLSVHLVGIQRCLMGRDFISNFLVALPSNFFIDKSTLLANEGLYNSFFQINIQDSANSYLTSAFFDFSWTGLFLYPSILYLTYNFLISFTLKTRYMLLYLLLLASLLTASCNLVEGAVTGLYVVIRNFFVLSLLFLFFKRLFAKF